MIFEFLSSITTGLLSTINTVWDFIRGKKGKSNGKESIL